MSGLKNIERYSYTLKTLSHLILSPRSSMAFYIDALIDETDKVYFDTNEVYKGGPKQSQEKYYHILYPFYRYGEYELFEPAKAKYYIPGSSLKGVLTKTTGRKQPRSGEHSLSLFVDDISTGLTWSMFEIISLQKSQYLTNLQNADSDQDTDVKDIPKLKEFFDGTVGFEALKPCETITGTLGLAGKLNDAKNLFTRASFESENRLTRYKKQIEHLKKQLAQARDNDQNNNSLNGERKKAYEKIEKQLDTVSDELSELINSDRNIISLGGYKGLLRSISEGKDETLDFGSAIFVDDNYLPFGIVEFLGVEKL